MDIFQRERADRPLVVPSAARSDEVSRREANLWFALPACCVIPALPKPSPLGKVLSEARRMRSPGGKTIFYFALPTLSVTPSLWRQKATFGKVSFFPHTPFFFPNRVAGNPNLLPR